MNVIQVYGSSLRDAVLRHVDGGVSIFVLDELQKFPESKGSDLQPGRARLNPGAIVCDASASGEPLGY